MGGRESPFFRSAKKGRGGRRDYQTEKKRVRGDVPLSFVFRGRTALSTLLDDYREKGKGGGSLSTERGRKGGRSLKHRKRRWPSRNGWRTKKRPSSHKRLRRRGKGKRETSILCRRGCRLAAAHTLRIAQGKNRATGLRIGKKIDKRKRESERTFFYCWGRLPFQLTVRRGEEEKRKQLPTAHKG